MAQTRKSSGVSEAEKILSLLEEVRQMAQKSDFTFACFFIDAASAEIKRSSHLTDETSRDKSKDIVYLE